jgi:hypothetical protein
MATRQVDSALKGKKSRSQSAMVSRDIYSLYVEEYIGLYLKILKTNGSARPYARFIKAQICDRLLSAITIRFNKSLAVWGSRGAIGGFTFT